MAIYRFQLTMPMDTALPADAITNTWYFSNPAAPVITDYDNVRDMLKDFYTHAPSAGGSALTTYLSDSLASPVSVKAYNLSDSAPRAPRYTSTFTWAPAGASQIPAENAIVLSYQAAQTSGVPQSRRRGRVYLGTWATSALNVGNGRVNATVQLQIARAAHDLRAAALASATWEWVQWSPTTQEATTVDNGWVDDAWDTQRRRGVKATNRQLWT